MKSFVVCILTALAIPAEMSTTDLNLTCTLTENRSGKVTFMGLDFASRICINVTASSKSVLPFSNQKDESGVCKRVKWNRHCDERSECAKFELATCLEKLDVMSKKLKSIIPDIAPTSFGRSLGGTTRVAGGQNAKTKEVPFIVNVFITTERICSGTIINQYYILLAAKCFQDRQIDLNHITVVVGDVRLNFKEKSEQILKPSKVLSHPLFMGGMYDIALIELEMPLHFNNAVQAAILPEVLTEPMGHVSVSGWGETMASQISNTLRITTAPIVPNAQCRTVFPGQNVTMHQVCIYNVGGTHCNDDAGGPMVQVYNSSNSLKCMVLVGVLQSAHECGMLGHASLASKVSAHIPWIQENVRPKMMQKAIRKYGKGTNADKHEFPYGVRIVKDGNTICGGAIMNERYVLTSASCLDMEAIADISVIAGDHAPGENDPQKQTAACEQFIIHRRFDRVSHKADIALIRLTTPLTLSIAVNKVNVPSPNAEPPNTPLMFTGWGSMSPNSSDETTLKKMGMRILDFNNCVQKYGCAFQTLQPLVLCACASPGASQSSCRGDYGGALTTKTSTGFLIYGIASYRVSCEDHLYPTVFTFVPQFRDWIDEEIKTHTVAMVPDAEFPFHVLIKSPLYPACGGIILNERFLLASAHCLNGVNVTNMCAYAGRKDSNGAAQPDQQILGIKSVTIHEQFNSMTYTHDIALVEVFTPIVASTKVQAAVLSEQSIHTNVDDSGMLTGFAVEQAAPDIGKAHKLHQSMINTVDCRREYMNMTPPVEIPAHVICTASSTDASCIGDPGSPLIQLIPSFTFCQRVLGIMSKQKNCSTQGPQPNVFTDTFVYKRWIQAHIEKASRVDSGAMTRIAGGVPAIPGEFPYQVQVVVNNEGVCGGVILNPFYIITSGICASKVEMMPTSVKTGGGTGSSQERAVVEFIKHEGFDIISRDNDIALLHLAIPLDLTGAVKNISIPTSIPIIPTGTSLEFCGWGMGANNQTTKPKALQKILLNTISTAACWTAYGCSLYARRSQSFCAQAMNPAGAGICEGDQGSPLTLNSLDNKPGPFLIGIASTRTGCLTGGLPSVFTNVPVYYDWIQSKNLYGGGTVPQPNDFPFQVLILHNGVPICGGTIVSRMQILTSAHCMHEAEGGNTSSWTILAGNDGLGMGNSSTLQQTRVVSAVIIHKDYNSNMRTNDLAMLHLQTPLEFNNATQSALLPWSSFVETGPVNVSSWRVGGGYQLLQKIAVHPITNLECSLAYKDTLQNVTDTMICTSQLASFICTHQTDFGGPMTYIPDHHDCHVLVGIEASPCVAQTPPRPNIYSSIPRFSNWINTLIDTLDEDFQEDQAPAATAAEYPFLMRIVNGTETICVGTLTDWLWVITAASCVADKFEDHLEVIAGDHNLNITERGELRRRVRAIIVFPGFNNVTRAYDIALLHLVLPMTASRQVQRIGVVAGTGSPTAPDLMHMAGWGNARDSSVLRHTPVKKIPVAECERTHRCAAYPFTEHTLCGSCPGGFGPGFLGAPLFSKGSNGLFTLWGLHSQRLGCDVNTCARLFTQVAELQDWISGQYSGGETIEPYQAPYQLAIRIRNRFECLGALLSQWYAVTSAACILRNFALGSKITDLFVYAGMWNLTQAAAPGKQVRNVKQVFHETNEQTRDKDVMLLELGTQVTFSEYISPILLPGANEEVGEAGVVSGFDFFSTVQPIGLRATTVPTIDPELCKTQYQGTRQVLTSSMVCTSGAIPQICFVQPGSPLAHAVGETCFKLAAINTFNRDCTRNRFPSVYTKVAQQVAFIQSKIDPQRALPTNCPPPPLQK